MTIYLVNPSEKRILDNAGDRVPIGLLSTAATLRKQGNDPVIYDLNHQKESDLMQSIEADDNPIVGISVYTSPIYLEAVNLAKRIGSKARLIAGGYHATAQPTSLLPFFDAVVTGEAETAFQYATELDGVITGRPPNLAEIPPPAYDLVDMENYNMQMDGLRTGTIISSRGCPFHCAFCGKMESQVRFEPIKKVLDEAKKLKGYGFEAIYFLDDVFTLKEERMKSILTKLDMPYRITTRANLLDKTKMDILKDTGAEWVSLGIESGNDRILRNSGKGMTTKQNYDAVMELNDRGIKTKGFFIIGLPGETRETALETIEFSQVLKKGGLTKADFYYLVPFPGTPIWKNPSDFGIEIIDRDYTKYLQAGKKARCVINTEKLKAKEIEELVTIANKKW